MKFFKSSEFEKCVPSCSLVDMDECFMESLDFAREKAGVPFVLNSAYRSPSWDVQHGRSGTGYHCLGRAADISCKDSYSRSKIVKACLSLGLTCGISKTFIHVDDRDKQICFLY